MIRHCCGSSSGHHRSRFRSRRRPRLLPIDCTVRSASIPHQVAAHRSDYSCRDRPRSKDHRSIRRCNRLPSRHPLHCGSSSMDHRRHTHCQRRQWLRHSGYIAMTRCIARRERDHPTSCLTRCRRRCHSRRRDWRSTERRSRRRRPYCGSSCGLRPRQCRYWHIRPTRRTGYIRWSTCIRRQASAHRCSHHRRRRH
jgi:hypothetical protein